MLHVSIVALVSNKARVNGIGMTGYGLDHVKLHLWHVAAAPIMLLV